MVVTIKLGRKKVKVFNLIFLVLVICLLFYVLLSLFFQLPFFKSKYNYELDGGNYKSHIKVSFKNKWFNCYVTENITIEANDKLVYNAYKKDLINDGYKLSGKDSYKRTYKIDGFCETVKKDYKKIHHDKYALFKLNGGDNELIEYGKYFNDPYVISKINEKDKKSVEINSNFNNNKIGSYIISYALKVDKHYKKRLYRIVKVIDNEKPIINMIGEENITLDYGSKYVEPGFTSSDNYDGNLTDKVEVKNTVNTKKAGTYIITYKVKDSSNNIASEKRTVIVKEKSISTLNENKKIEIIDGITYVNGILIVNKTYGLPKNYDPKVNKEALNALEIMQADARVLGLKLPLVSGYRSYGTQENLYNKYVKKDGENKANTYSAKPGHSEHQTGLAFDVGSTLGSFANTDEAKWLDENCHLYGFIIRYPKGKTNITGYIYEPWHIRYLGKEISKKVKESGLTLEEYLGL